MKSYPTYKPTGIAWLPQIPEHWELKRNKNIFIETKDIVGDKSDQYSLLSLTQKGIIFRDVLSGKGKFPKDFNTYKIIQKGDMAFCLFDIDETPRTIGLSPYEGMLTGAYTIFHVRNINPKYAEYYYISIDNVKALRPLYSGLRKTISTNTFLGSKLPVPPRDEQDQIVRFLDWKVSVINHLINVKHREIKAIDEIKRSMISNAVTHGINFDTPMKYSGIKWLGVIPIHWKLIRGKNLYEKLQRPVKNTDDVVTCFRDGTVTLRKNRRTTGFTESLKEIGYQGIQKGDLVIHVMDAFAGSIGVSDSDGKGTPVYSICQAKTDSNNYYYAFLLREMARTGFIQSLYRGIRERSSDFRFEVFGKQFYPAPPRAEQDEIVDYLGKRTEEIEKYITIRKLQIAELEDLRRCLISDVVTGKIDVRDIEIPEYESVEDVLDENTEDAEEEEMTAVEEE